MGQKKVDRFDVNLINEKNFHEYILEIDFEYHDELHRLHNHHPLALEKLEISRDMLSRYCNDFADKYGTKTGGVNKLVPNLGKKGYVRYVLHEGNIELYLLFGIKLIKVHRTLAFKQLDWLMK